jgi:hypothetical protein
MYPLTSVLLTSIGKAFQEARILPDIKKNLRRKGRTIRLKSSIVGATTNSWIASNFTTPQ